MAGPSPHAVAVAVLDAATGPTDRPPVVLGPPELGLVGRPVDGPHASDDRAATGADGARGGATWRVVAAPGLDGPPGILQGGLASALPLAVARVVDRYGAPLTELVARLVAPTPLGVPLTVTVRPTATVARSAVRVLDGERLLVEAEVELAGPEPAAQLGDLVAVAASDPPPDTDPMRGAPSAAAAGGPAAADAWRLGAERAIGAYPRCVVCGPDADHPLALHVPPRWHGEDLVHVPWVAEEALASAWSGPDAVDPLVVAAALDCPSAWAAMPRAVAGGAAAILLAGLRLRVAHPVPVLDPLSVVGRCDDVDGRKLRARAAVVDDEGRVLAWASALHVAVAHLPDARPADGPA